MVSSTDPPGESRMVWRGAGLFFEAVMAGVPTEIPHEHYTKDFKGLLAAEASNPAVLTRM
jgi:hypothetical protein